MKAMFMEFLLWVLNPKKVELNSKKIDGFLQKAETKNVYLYYIDNESIMCNSFLTKPENSFKSLGNDLFTIYPLKGGLNNLGKLACLSTETPIIFHRKTKWVEILCIEYYAHRISREVKKVKIIGSENKKPKASFNFIIFNN